MRQVAERIPVVNTTCQLVHAVIITTAEHSISLQSAASVIVSVRA